LSYAHILFNFTKLPVRRITEGVITARHAIGIPMAARQATVTWIGLSSYYLYSISVKLFSGIFFTFRGGPPPRLLMSKDFKSIL
jgi:hypothetical protein